MYGYSCPIELPRAKLSIVGSLLVLVSVASWFASIASVGGTSLFFGSYEEYLEATSSSSGAFSLIWFGLGVGLCFSATSPPSNWRRLSFGIFVIFALFALPIGLRGEVLFPTLAAAVIAVRRRRKLPSIRVALLVGSAILVAIALFHDVRQVGLQNFSNSALSGNLLDGLAEMGGTLRPVVEVTRWHNSGEEFIKGASYLAPFDRALDVILGQPRLAAQNDPRLMNVLVVSRNLGHIGFSPVAEAYHNFATLGVVAVMSGIGLLVGRMSQWPLTASYQALIGIILVELLINVRNAFVAVPVHIIVGCLLLSTVVIVARSIETGQRSHPGSLKAYSASRPLQRR